LDLTSYSLEDLFLSALKSEVDSNAVYSKLAESVKNAFLKERLKFLADEEEHHRIFLIKAYKENFQDMEPTLPETSPVPLPEIIIPDERVPISEVLESAMKAELASRDFYLSFTDRFDDQEMKKTLEYFALMEEGHYKLLKVEKENSLKFENYDEYWPMMHAGP
jgi:rubrerythrin